MQQYGMLQALYMSFYSRRLYRDVAVNWGGKSCVYLLMILALSWLVFTIHIQRSINMVYTTVSDTFVAQIPVMTIADGKLSTPESRPYIIKDPKTDQDLIIIDVTGQYTSLDQTSASLLVTDSKILMRPKPDQQRIYNIPNKINVTIKPDRVNDAIKYWIQFFCIPIYIFALIFSYVYRILQALVYAVIGKLFSMIAGVQISYWQSLQIAMVAITPVIVICTILNSIGVFITHHNLFYFALAMIYLIYGVMANKNSDIQLKG